MESINYNHLYYFWVIAKEGGVTHACKKLNLTQPTLSAQLKQFEESIGHSLFDRKSRKLVLNEKGRIVLDYADSIFKKSQEMLEAISDQTTQDTITISVGTEPALPKKNLHNYLKPLLSKRNIRFNLTSDDISQLAQALSNHELDVVFSITTPVEHPKDIRCDVIEKIPLVVVGKAEHKPLKRKFPQSLNGQDIYLPTCDQKLIQDFHSIMEKSGVTPRIRGHIDDYETLRVIASSGHGLVVIPRSAISDLIKSKEVSIIGDNLNLWQNFYLLTAKRKDPHPLVADYLKRFGEGMA